jgi:hypothetical protein
LLPAGDAAPVYAFPVHVRTRLEAIVFLGAHISGEQVDPEELETVGHLLEAAAIAYEHVEAQAAINRAAALESENSTLRDLIVARGT